MQRKHKIILCIVGIILGIAIVISTIFIAKNNITVADNNTHENLKMDKGIDENSSDSSSNKSKKNNAVDNEAPQIPNDSQNEDSTKKKSSSATVDSTSIMSTSNEEDISLKPSNFIDVNAAPKLTIVYIVTIALGILLFTVSLLYLILSKLGINNVFISSDKIVIFILTTIIISALLSILTIHLINNYVLLSNAITNISEPVIGDLDTAINETNFSA